MPVPSPAQHASAPDCNAIRAMLCIDNVGTQVDMAPMPKRPSSQRGDSALATAEWRPAGDRKSSINLRIEAQTRQLIDDAAAALGKMRTEFMVESARKAAIDVLLDQRLFVLDPERHDAFVHVLDNPPAPGPRLRALLRRVPAWKT